MTYIVLYAHMQIFKTFHNLLLEIYGATVEVWEWTSNFISQLSGHVITYPCGDES